jgi:high-affinity iron transporter
LAVLKKSAAGTRLLILASALIVVAVLIWQGIVSQGVPSPDKSQPESVAILNISLLVFREGLECILVLAAIMANMVGAKAHYRRPVTWGAVLAFGATIITWFIAVKIIDDISENVSALHLQAATGLLAIVVLLIIMNWFFHKVYWGGWIGMHTKKKRALLHADEESSVSKVRLLTGLAILGFTSFYREGFEVVLFLQSYRLKMGGNIVLAGAGFGLFLCTIVAILTFVAHHRLPYRKMLVFTGVMLAVVLMVMVGEQVQEMQLAGWLPKTEIAFMESIIPGWAGMWLAIFPNVEGLVLQALSFVIVAGSYFAARGMSHKKKVQPDDESSVGVQPELAGN